LSSFPHTAFTPVVIPLPFLSSSYPHYSIHLTSILLLYCTFCILFTFPPLSYIPFTSHFSYYYFVNKVDISDLRYFVFYSGSCFLEGVPGFVGNLWRYSCKHEPDKQFLWTDTCTHTTPPLSVASVSRLCTNLMSTSARYGTWLQRGVTGLPFIRLQPSTQYHGVSGNFTSTKVRVQ
jgi:hypothetical protein